jgi:hypothetical protein
MGGITNPTEEYFKDGIWGHDGTRWRKLNLVWGYYDRLCEQQANLNAAAGVNFLNHTAVPVGEVWVVTGASAVDSNTATLIQLGMTCGAAAPVVFSYGTPVAGTWVATPAANYVLKAGDLMWTLFVACALNDDIYSNIWGYKMRIV